MNKTVKEESKSREREGDSHLERCKKIGRVGPWETRLHKDSSYGEAFFHGQDKLEVEAVSSFYSVRATTGVFSGRYYFEV